MKVFYTDASTLNNGRPGQKTFIVITDEYGDLIKKKYVGNYTINEGEALGVWYVMDKLIKDEQVVVYTDSKLVENWVKKGFSSKSKATPVTKKAISLIQNYCVQTKSKVRWISRDNNLAGILIEKSNFDYKLEPKLEDLVVNSVF